jgi:hypothetical protein
MLVLRGIHIFRIAGDKIVERWGPAAAWSTEGDPSQGFGGPASPNSSHGPEQPAGEVDALARSSLGVPAVGRDEQLASPQLGASP